MSPLEFFLIFLLVTASAFLSLSEIALVGISKIRLRHMADRGVRGAKTAQGLVSQLDQVITTILVWSSFINAALTGLVTAACIGALGQRVGVLVATLIAGSTILFLVDILPKVYAVRHADEVSLWVSPPMRLLVRIFHPIARGVTRLTNWAFRLVGISTPSRSPLVTEEELKLMIEMGKEEGVLGEHERGMLHRIFEFGDLKVRDVMVPRDRAVVIRQGATHDEVLTVLTEQGHSRVPVYEDSPDRIVGVIYAQEILHIWREGWLIVLQDLTHPPFEVSPQMRVAELLQEFQRRRIQIAIVVDAQGKALGLVTLEDLLEEIVGEIHERQS
ncbi:MAG: HlyC/CorC family transporter [Candidatus Omnitrophica bacterium]|nr:HlyC/CorC family transporter [Candidatus Omnitrophota bacterium]